MKVVELFAGIGSQHKALDRIGIKATYKISEIDKYAINSYNAIHGETFNYGDITKIKEEDIESDIDLLTYSSPCQSFSIAGKMEGGEKDSGTKSSLLWYVEKFIKIAKPKYLLMENVKNLVSKKFIGCFNKWLELLTSYGYDNYWQVLDAKDYGIPQHRERVFVVSIRKDLNKKYEFPEKEELKLKLKDLLEQEVDEKYYLSDKMKHYLTNENTKGYNRKEVFENAFKNCNEKGIANTINTRAGSRPVDNFIGTWNSTYRTNDNTKYFNNTLTQPKEEIVYENMKIRKLTPKECFCLMGFDDEDYKKVKKAGISDAQMYKIMGNSIVVNVLKKIFYNLFYKNFNNKYLV